MRTMVLLATASFLVTGACQGTRGAGGFDHRQAALLPGEWLCIEEGAQPKEWNTVMKIEPNGDGGLFVVSATTQRGGPDAKSARMPIHFPATLRDGLLEVSGAGTVMVQESTDQIIARLGLHGGYECERWARRTP